MPAQLAHGLAAAVPVCQVCRSSCCKAGCKCGSLQVAAVFRFCQGSDVDSDAERSVKQAPEPWTNFEARERFNFCQAEDGPQKDSKAALRFRVEGLGSSVYRAQGLGARLSWPNVVSWPCQAVEEVAPGTAARGLARV